MRILIQVSSIMQNVLSSNRIRFNHCVPVRFSSLVLYAFLKKALVPGNNLEFSSSENPKHLIQVFGSCCVQSWFSLDPLRAGSVYGRHSLL